MVVEKPISLLQVGEALAYDVGVGVTEELFISAQATAPAPDTSRDRAESGLTLEPTPAPL